LRHAPAVGELEERDQAAVNQTALHLLNEAVDTLTEL
jgi:hypothetical protein